MFVFCPVVAQRSRRSSQFTCIPGLSQCRGCWGGRLCSRRARNRQWEPTHKHSYIYMYNHTHVSICCSYTYTYRLYRSRWAINAVCRAQIGPQRLLNLQNISVSVCSLCSLQFSSFLTVSWLTDPFLLLADFFVFVLRWSYSVVGWKQIWSSLRSWNNFKLSKVVWVIYGLLWWCSKVWKKCSQIWPCSQAKSLHTRSIN